MNNKIDLNKIIYSKESYTGNIDTQFKELGVTSIIEDLNNNLSVEEFFNQYNSLFYLIPKEGENNSHEYLTKTSGDYINFTQINEQILALQQEISSLRETNLQLNIKLIESQTGQTFNITSSLQIN